MKPLLLTVVIALVVLLGILLRDQGAETDGPATGTREAASESSSTQAAPAIEERSEADDPRQDLHESPVESPSVANEESAQDATHSLVLQLVDATDQRPIEGLFLQLSAADREPLRARSNEQGLCRFEQLTTAVLRLDHVTELPRFPTRCRLNPDKLALNASTPERLVIEVTQPQLVIDILVEEQNGEPAEAARVQLLSYDTEQPDWPERVRVATSDADGHAYFGLFNGDSEATAMKVFADRIASNEVTPLVEVPATPSPRASTSEAAAVVRLGIAASLEVRVLDENGSALAGAKVHAIWAVIRQPFLQLWKPLNSDRNGLCVLRGLAAGQHEVRVTDPRSRESHTETVALRLGEQATVEFRLAAKEQLAVAGRVLDEDGQPLPRVYLRYHLQGDPDPWGGRSDAEGYFELWLEPQPELTSLTVDTRSELDSDWFEPERITVPFGTRGVELRRTAEPVTTWIEFEVRDAVSGRAIEGASIWEYDAQLDEGLAHAQSDANGRALAQFQLRDGRRWGIRAESYLDQEGELADVEAAQQPGDAQRLRINLEAGVHRRRLISHWYSGEALAGARVYDPRTRMLLATSDEQGWVVEQGTPWPEEVLIESDGFEAKLWSTRQRNGWKLDHIGLVESNKTGQVADGDE